LHRKHRVYMQYVGIATAPEAYATRMARMFPSAPWKRLSLFALDATDIALSKLERNAERDREDVVRLARAGHINLTSSGSAITKSCAPIYLARSTGTTRRLISGSRWRGRRVPIHERSCSDDDIQ
jgi:hypothetical protein